MSATVDTVGNILINPSHSMRGTPCPPRSSRPTRPRSTQSSVDPVTLDIIENALRNARVEMDAVLVRTAMSPGIREQGDAFPLIADHKGRMIVGQFGWFIGGFLDGL